MRLIFIQQFSKEQILFLYQLPYQLSSESQSIIIQIKTNFMAFKASTLALTALMMLLVSTQNIVDFTYTQYDSRSGKTTRQKDVVVIKPTASIIQGYSFPDACSLAKQLEEQKTEDSRQIADYDMDSMIENLKVDFIEMLKVSEKIKNKKNNIQELSQLSGLYTNVSVVSQKQLDMLKISENKLLEINNEIGTKTADLQLMVKDAMISSGGNQFALMSVNFEIQSLKLKLQYLNNLKQKSTDQDKAKTKDQYSKYFTDLRDRFDIETDLIDNLATILQNWNEIRALRSKISSIKGKIEIVNLMIEEKEVCVKQREQIKKVQKYHHQIKSHMANLREKKKDNTNINNKYCQGVAKKLEDRVKNVLKTYDYTFQCAKGVNALKEEKNNHQQELKKAEQRLSQLEKRGADDYKQKFEENRKFMKTKQEELSKFYIPKYYHNIDELDDLITKTTRQMKDAQQTRRTLGSPSNRKDVDYRKIQELVSAIKRLKGTYCQQYENYDNKAQKLWKQVQKHEAEVEYNSKMRGVYEDEINELRDLQNKFQQLRSKILLQIQSQ